jgi:hypothetical protein
MRLDGIENRCVTAIPIIDNGLEFMAVCMLMLALESIDMKANKK